MPWPPPPGSQPPPGMPPPGMPPVGQPPGGELSDTQRMLQPQGLFSGQRPVQPQPWPGSGGSASLFAPPLPPDAGARDGLSSTLPHGMQPVPPGGEYPPGGQYPPGPPYPPGGQYPPGPPYPPGGQYPPGTYAPGNEYPPGGGYPPGGPYPPGTYFDPGGSPRTGGGRPWSRLPSGPTPVIIAVVLVLVLAGVVIAVLHGGSGSGGATAGSTTGATPTTNASTSAQAEQQAATQLAGLLPQSGADRGAVIDADVDVQNCGKNLAQDESTFAKSAANRQSLLSRLAVLPGRSALRPAMVSALTGAWQASVKADTDLAKWAQDELAHGCRKSKVANDPNLKASYGPDGQATADKQTFTSLWNPLARKYGLKTYQVGDL